MIHCLKALKRTNYHPISLRKSITIMCPVNFCTPPNLRLLMLNNLPQSQALFSGDHSRHLSQGRRYRHRPHHPLARRPPSPPNPKAEKIATFLCGSLCNEILTISEVCFLEVRLAARSALECGSRRYHLLSRANTLAIVGGRPAGCCDSSAAGVIFAAVYEDQKAVAAAKALQGPGRKPCAIPLAGTAPNWAGHDLPAKSLGPETTIYPSAQTQ
jgi:hypothetical protein